MSFSRPRSMGIALLALVTATGCSGRHQREHLRNVHLLAGPRAQVDSNWGGWDDQGVLGVEFDSYDPDGWVGWEGGLSYARASRLDQNVSLDAQTYEAYGGVRRTWSQGTFYQYVGGGLSVLRGEFESLEPDSQSKARAGDFAVGAYVHGGLYWKPFGEVFAVGLDLRYLAGTDFRTDEVRVSPDYVQLALRLGAAF